MSGINFKLNPWQKEVVKKITEKQIQFVSVVAGRRAGKTYLLKYLIYYYAFKFPKSKIAVIYPSYKQSKEVLFNEFIDDQREFPQLFAKQGSIYKPTLKVTFANGSSVQVFSLEYPKSIRGLKLKLAIVDETQELKPGQGTSVISDIVLPTLTPLVGEEPGKCLLFGTSKGRSNDFYGLLQRGKNPEYPDWYSFVIPTTTRNCPHLDPTFLNNIHKTMEGRSYMREYMCSFESYEGIIYSGFSRDVHLVPSVINAVGERKFTKTIIGLDFGFSPHPMAISVIMKYEDKYVIVDELKKLNMTVTEDSLISVLRHYVEHYHATHIMVSPEENANIKTLQNAIKNVHVIKAKNAVADGITHVRSLLHYNKKKDIDPKLYILDSCTETIKEFEGYTYKDGTETPLKILDDLMDASRYALFTDSKLIQTTTKAGRTYY